MSKVLFWDVETTSIDVVVRTYRLRNHIKYFSPDLISRDWSMLGAAWAYGDGEPVAVSVTAKDPLNDEKVIRKLHEVLGRAEVLVGHNSDGFDLKMFNTRAAYYGLRPLSQKVQLDTLKMARKYFRFSSNKLSYVCQYLGLEMKDNSPDWDECLLGNAKELRYMREYNKQDVVATRDLYHRLKSWHHNHPRVADKLKAIDGSDVDSCPVCGSADSKKNGTKLMGSGRRKQVIQCLGCGKFRQGGFVS